jgi:enamine deaminase RidA (YjgF/YER057c/UK114 family)
MSAIRRVSSPDVTEPPAELWSNCLVCDGIVYFSGMTARDRQLKALADADTYEQSRVIFGKLKFLVEAAGGSMADVVKLTIFVTNILNREEVWRARREFFTGNFPACTLVQVAALAEPAILLEIEGVAHLGASQRA